MTGQDWRAAKQRTGELETAGEWLKSYFPATQVLLESLLGVGWWGVVHEGEKEVRRLWGRKVSPELPLTGKSLHEWL